MTVLYVIVIIAAAVYLWRRVGLRFTATSLALLIFLVLYGPAHVVFHFVRETDASLYEALTIALSLMWAGLVAGIEIVEFLLPRHAAVARASVLEWETAPSGTSYAAGSLFSPLAFGVMLALVAHLLGEGVLGKIYSYYTASASELQMLAVRREEGGSAFYLFNLITLTVAPFFCFVLLLKALRRASAAAWAAFLGAAALVLLAKLGTLQKSPAAIFVLQMLVAIWLSSHNRIRALWIVAMVLVFLAVMVPLSFVAYQELGLAALMNYFVYRAFEVPQEVLVAFFSVFPERLGFLGGEGIRLWNVFRGETDYVAPAMAVASVLGSEGASFNALFIADAWAEFAYAGVLLASIALGAALRGFDLYALHYGKSEESVALFASAVWSVVYVSSASFAASLVSGGLLLVPFVSWLARQCLVPMAMSRDK